MWTAACSVDRVRRWKPRTTCTERREKMTRVALRREQIADLGVPRVRGCSQRLTDMHGRKLRRPEWKLRRKQRNRTAESDARTDAEFPWWWWWCSNKAVSGRNQSPAVWVVVCIPISFSRFGSARSFACRAVSSRHRRDGRRRCSHGLEPQVGGGLQTEQAAVISGRRNFNLKPDRASKLEISRALSFEAAR